MAAQQPTALGLHVPEWRERAIPGNHDHWPGPMIVGPSSPSLAAMFPVLPFDRPLTVGNCPRPVRLLGIDTDSLVTTHGVDRLFARGRFSDQLDALEARIPPGSSADEIRVLLMHHSPFFPLFVGGISRTSRRRTRDFLRTRGIRVVLCGHTHRAEVVRWPSEESPEVLIACSGATTQRTELGIVPAEQPRRLREQRLCP